MTVSLGFDPEFFITDKGRRTPVPVCGLLGGTKDAPLPLSMDWSPEYNYHEDNVVAEIGIPYALDSNNAFVNLTQGMTLLDDKLAEKNLRKLSIAEYEFPTEALSSAQAQEFGCDPDYDAYTGGARPRTRVPNFGNFRFAGGHIHLGGDFQCPAFVVALMCDLAIGARVNAKRGASSERTKWYGKAGTYRVKDYGIEYRTLDSCWLACENERYEVVNRAWRVARWCEDTSARNIKKVMDAVNWAAVRAQVETCSPGRFSEDMLRTYKVARDLGAPL